MTLRGKFFLTFMLAVVSAVAILAFSVERYVERQFRESDQQHSAALAEQFQSELAQRGSEVSAAVQGIADAESTMRMVLDLNRATADPSVYANDARGLAKSRDLDFLELAAADGTVISSAQWPERVGSKDALVVQEPNWNQKSAFLDRVETAERVDLGLMAVHMVRAGSKNFYIIGGRRLDSDFLRSLAIPAGMRALFYRNLEASFVPSSLLDSDGPLNGAESFASLIQSLPKQPGASPRTIEWTGDSSNSERFITLPLAGRRGELLGALLVGSAQGQLNALEMHIRGWALAIAGAGILLAFLMSWWISIRVSRPLETLGAAIREVAAGDWDAQVKPAGSPEVKQVLRSFNRMAAGLVEERTAQVARERASAGRELAAQLSGELNSLLSPLHREVEALASRKESHEENAAVEGSLDALRGGLKSLGASGNRLREFASLSAPRLESVNLADALRAALQALEPQFSAIGRPPVTPELYLDDRMAPVRADPALLRKALDSLLLFLLEDMPTGGTLTIRTRQQSGMAHMILSDTGAGTLFEQQDSGQPFSPYRVARASGAALRLATVQAIISGHAGKISMESARGTGLTFYVDLPSDGWVSSTRPQSKPQAISAKPVPAKVEPRPEPASETHDEQMPAVQQPSLPVDVGPELALQVRARDDEHAQAEIDTEPEVPAGIASSANEWLQSEDMPEIEPLEETAEAADEEDWSALADVLHEAQMRLNAEEPESSPKDSQEQRNEERCQDLPQQMQQKAHASDSTTQPEPQLEAAPELVHAGAPESTKPSPESESRRIWLRYR